MESTATEVSTQLAQLNLKTNGSNGNGTAAPSAAVPMSPVSPNSTNTSTPRPRTGIPRYAIPYRRPDQKPSIGDTSDNNNTNGNNSAMTSPLVSPTVSETAAAVSGIPQSGGGGGRNGVRTESLGDASISSSGFGVGSASQRYGRAASVDPLRGDSESENSSAFSSSGQPRRITSKIGSLANANYKPGGGNVKILDTKVDFSYAQSKCNSKANLKHKPGGGDVQIVNNKLDFKENSRSRINSLANAKHVPGGGNVKMRSPSVDDAGLKDDDKLTQCRRIIETRKLEFKETAAPRVGSLQNASHKAGGGNVKIFNEKLPWLKYNKPNLPPEEKAKINKHTPLAQDARPEPIYTSRHSSTAS